MGSLRRRVIPYNVEMGPAVIDEGLANRRTWFNASAQLNPVANSLRTPTLGIRRMAKASSYFGPSMDAADIEPSGGAS